MTTLLTSTYFRQLVLSLLSCPILLFFTHSSLAMGNQKKYVVIGRVIDKQGNAVSKARVFLQPYKTEQYSGDGLIITTATDSQGRFRLEDIMMEEILELKLFAISPLPPATFECIPPPFYDLTDSIKSLKGLKILIKLGQVLDLGDVLVQTSYGKVKLRLQDNAGEPLLDQPQQWAKIKLRIRDKKGDILREQYLAWGKTNNDYIQLKESIIGLALPEGKWVIEIGILNNEERWLTLDDWPVSVTPGKTKTFTLVDSPSLNGGNPRYFKEILARVKNSTTAKRELIYLGIKYNEDSFVERAEKGNYLAVKLFLLSKMPAMTRSGNGVPVLVAAAKYPNILQALLSAGADVNSKDNAGVTPLMLASANGLTPSMNVLHSNRASVNERIENGTTALLLAVANGHYEAAKLLLSWGADPNSRNNVGLSALKLAELRGSEDIVILLRNAGARD